MAIDNSKHVGEQYESKNGIYEIIEYLGGKHPKVKVKFDLTGSEVICRYDTARNGFALDPEYINFLYVGKKYDTCCGPVTILKDLGFYKKCYFVWIRFEYTGYECEERLKNILKGYAYDPGYFMYTVKDKIFHSNNYGDFKIIADIGRDKHHFRIVRVRFIATGYEYDVRYDTVQEGTVKDPTYFMYTVKDKIFHSNNYGDFKIIENLGFTKDKKHRVLRIKFLNTGAEAIVKYDDITNGEVKDPTYNTKYHARQIIGPTQMQNIERQLNTIWRDMMERCYNNNIPSYKSYGAKGVTVAPEWHDFNIFERDVINIPGWVNKFNDPVNYNLDKDLLQYFLPHSMRVYSKDTCIWLNRMINQRLMINGANVVNVFYNSIYQVDNLYYVKTLTSELLNYGPFDSLDAAINMLNYCYSSIGLYQLLIPINNVMTQEQVFQHTNDRRIAIKIVNK